MGGKGDTMIAELAQLMFDIVVWLGSEHFYPTKVFKQLVSLSSAGLTLMALSSTVRVGTRLSARVSGARCVSNESTVIYWHCSRRLQDMAAIVSKPSAFFDFAGARC